LVYIEFDQAYATDVHWIYLLDPQYKSNRFTEQKNLSKDTCPPDKTVLCFEKSCDVDDEFWQSSDEDLFHQVVQEDIGPNPYLNEKMARRYHVVRLQHAYPVYDLSFDQNLRVVLDGLAKIKNLYSIGRQGIFLQNDMHSSMIMGWEIGDFACFENPKPPWNWYQKILRRWDMD